MKKKPAKTVSAGPGAPPVRKAVAARPHNVVKGKCMDCNRTGGDLKTPCPGYRTAAELGTNLTDPGNGKLRIARVTPAVERVLTKAQKPQSEKTTRKEADKAVQEFTGLKPKPEKTPKPAKAKQPKAPAAPAAPVDPKVAAAIQAEFKKHMDKGEGKCASIRALAKFPLEAVLGALPDLSPSTVRIQHKGGFKS